MTPRIEKLCDAHDELDCPECNSRYLRGSRSPCPAARPATEPCSYHGQPDARTCPFCAAGEGWHARAAEGE